MQSLWQRPLCWTLSSLRQTSPTSASSRHTFRALLSSRPENRKKPPGSFRNRGAGPLGRGRLRGEPRVLRVVLSAAVRRGGPRRSCRRCRRSGRFDFRSLLLADDVPRCSRGFPLHCCCGLLLCGQRRAHLTGRDAELLQRRGRVSEPIDDESLKRPENGNDRGLAVFHALQRILPFGLCSVASRDDVNQLLEQLNERRCRERCTVERKSLVREVLLRARD